MDDISDLYCIANRLRQVIASFFFEIRRKGAANKEVDSDVSLSTWFFISDRHD